jgi:2-amino-4-hydroxy-6-hydroxymethyldihydropteridine diphosphokinase
MTTFIALGANLPSERFGPPRATLEAALDLLAARDLPVARRSRWYESAPVPASDQPWFVNGVAQLTEVPTPAETLRRLHDIEAELGRVRSVANAPRAVDLDLIDAGGRLSAPDAWPRLPHPRLHERAFVLLPLAELAPDWRHPETGQSIDALIARLPAGQTCRPIAGERSASNGPEYGPES